MFFTGIKVQVLLQDNNYSSKYITTLIALDRSQARRSLRSQLICNMKE